MQDEDVVEVVDATVQTPGSPLVDDDFERDISVLAGHEEARVRFDGEPGFAVARVAVFLDELELDGHLSRIGDCQCPRCRLVEVDLSQDDFGRVDRHLRQELVLQFVQLLHHLLVDFPVADRVDHFDAAVDDGAHRLVVAHAQRWVAAVLAHRDVVPFTEDAVAPGRRPVLLARVPIIRAGVVLVRRSETDRCFLISDEDLASGVLAGELIVAQQFAKVLLVEQLLDPVQIQVTAQPVIQVAKPENDVVVFDALDRERG